MLLSWHIVAFLFENRRPCRGACQNVLEVNVALQNVLPASALFPRVEVATIHVLSIAY